MNRMDRLTAILLLLQGGKRTATEIAQRFEVSRRTILRDIQALCEMGIPIGAELGSSGGYSLPADYSLPPLALTLHEALLLRLALSSLAQLSEAPFKKERESLLAKVETLLPRHEREDLEQFAQTLSISVPSRPYPTPFLDQLITSARDKQWLAVTYRSEKATSQKMLLPIHVRSEAGFWYCDAFSYERQETRMYRVDRFLALKTIPPPQLEHHNSNISYVHPSFPEVSIQLTARGVLRLEHEPHLASHIQRTDNGEGWLNIRLRPQEYDWLVRLLLSLGTDARVYAPEELHRRVQQAIQKLAHHYVQI